MKGGLVDAAERHGRSAWDLQRIPTNRTSSFVIVERDTYVGIVVDSLEKVELKVSNGLPSRNEIVIP
jgi:hypothetical protein